MASLHLDGVYGSFSGPSVTKPLADSRFTDTLTIHHSRRQLGRVNATRWNYPAPHLLAVAHGTLFSPFSLVDSYHSLAPEWRLRCYHSSRVFQPLTRVEVSRIHRSKDSRQTSLRTVHSFATIDTGNSNHVRFIPSRAPRASETFSRSITPFTFILLFFFLRPHARRSRHVGDRRQIPSVCVIDHRVCWWNAAQARTKDFKHCWQGNCTYICTGLRRTRLSVAARSSSVASRACATALLSPPSARRRSRSFHFLSRPSCREVSSSLLRALPCVSRGFIPFPPGSRARSLVFSRLPSRRSLLQRPAHLATGPRTHADRSLPFSPFPSFPKTRDFIPHLLPHAVGTAACPETCGFNLSAESCFFFPLNEYGLLRVSLFGWH